MIILLIVAVVVIYEGLARFMAGDNGVSGSRSTGTPLRPRPKDPGTPAGGVAAGRDMEQSTWTALDDIQLNRLLKESS